MEYQQLADEYINGSGELYEDRNPASLDHVLAKFRLFTADDVERAFENAERGFERWSSTPSPRRGLVLMRAGEIMESRIEEAAKLLTLEEGKTLAESRAEVARSSNLFKFYGALAFKHGGLTLPSSDPSTRIITIKEPLGVVATITPWNFPLSIPAWKTAPALAAGNSVVLKPATKTPLIAAMMADVLTQAGLPHDVLNLVVGHGGSVGHAVVGNESVAALSFTGSTATGMYIHEKLTHKKRMTRLQLELGGKNAVYVHREAELDLAVEIVMKSAFGLTGQSCTATSRVIVDRTLESEFKAKLSGALKNWRVGPGLQPEVNMGPMADGSQFRKVLEYVELGRQEGAKLYYAASVEGLAGGYYIGPHVFDGVTRDMRIFQEEIFGPVLSVTPAESLDEAIELVNSVPYGHTAGIVSRDHNAINRFIDRVEAGVIKVNKPTVGLELQAPFGGFKASGTVTWKEMGEEALEFYSREKTAYMGY